MAVRPGKVYVQKADPRVAQQKSVNVQSARKEIVRRELLKRGQLQQPKTSFTQNFKNDFGTFAKGALVMGKEAVTHPINSSKTVGGVALEAAKLIPKAAQGLGSNIKQLVTHPIAYNKQGFSALKQLHNTSYDKTEAVINELAKRSQSIPDTNKKHLAQLAAGLLGTTAQEIAHPVESFYNKPFTTTLDALSLGAGKAVTPVLKAGAKVAESTKLGSKVINAAREVGDKFTPLGGLKRKGYGDVAESFQNTQTKTRKAQEGIIRSTVERFKGFSKEEKRDFFDSIDTYRRDPSVRPSSSNTKVKQAIDHYLDVELPQIKRGSGIIERRAGVKSGIEKKLVSQQQAALQEHLRRMATPETKRVTSGVNFSAKPSRYNVSDILRSVRKELGNKGKKPLLGGPKKLTSEEIVQSALRELQGKKDTPFTRKEIHYQPSTNRAASLKPTSLQRSSGRIVPAKTRMSRSFIDKQLGVTAPIRNKRAGKIHELETMLQDYKNNPEGIKNYLHHYFAPSKEAVSGTTKLSKPQRGFLKRSTDAEGYVKDPVVAIAGVKTKIARANIQDDFAKGVFKKYGVSKEKVREFQGGKIINNETGEELSKYRGQYLPKELGDELTRIETKNETVHMLLTPLRVFNRNWKPLATAVRPRYHVRNVVGNLYNAIFVGGMDPRRIPTAAFQQLKSYIGEEMKSGSISGKVYKSFFKTPPESSLYKRALEDDVIGRGFFSADINDVAEIAEKASDIAKEISKLEYPSEIYRVPILGWYIKKVSAIGSVIEDNARLSLYADRLRKGASRAEAKAYVNKHLFDYLNGLGEADRIIKQFIPFWAWTRFNVPLQVGAIGKLPLRHTAIQHGMGGEIQSQEQNNQEYQYLSQREKDQGAVKIGEITDKEGKVSDRYMRTQDVLPIADLNKIADVSKLDFSAAGGSPLTGIIEQLKYRINPPTNPNENLDFFGRPVEDYPGEVKRFLNMPVQGTTKEILSSVPLVTEVNKLIGGSYEYSKRPDLSDRVKITTSPASEFISDREQNRKQFVRNFENTTGNGGMVPGYKSELSYIVKQMIEKPGDKVIRKNFETLKSLLRQAGNNASDIQKMIEKSFQSYIKTEYPQPKRGAASRNRPTRRPKSDIDYSLLNKYSDKLKPFFTK